MTSKWIDISVPLHNSTVYWPHDPKVSIQRISDLAKGDKYNTSRISLGSHSGTHIDAPLHVIKRGQGVAEIPLEILIGPARVIEINDNESIKPVVLVQHKIRRGERILFKTLNSSQLWHKSKFSEKFVHISIEAANLLAKLKTKLVGIDYLSVSSYQDDGIIVHKTLLGAGVLIIEGLNLANVIPGKYQLICLPLKIDHGDGAPARAILKAPK
jgi:arylformamidase